MKIRTGDTVLVISGKDRNKTGKVIRVLPDKNCVVVEGINLRVKYIKKTEQKAGQRITFEASMPSSKVMALDPKTKKPTRVGYKVDPKSGKKERIALASGTVIPANATVKPEKKTQKTQTTQKTQKKNSSESFESSESSASKKGPFWQRMGFGKGGAIQEDSTHKSVEPDHPVMQPAHKPQGRGK